jgi:hypothetical protein
MWVDDRDRATIRAALRLAVALVQKDMANDAGETSGAREQYHQSAHRLIARFDELSLRFLGSTVPRGIENSEARPDRA